MVFPCFSWRIRRGTMKENSVSWATVWRNQMTVLNVKLLTSVLLEGLISLLPMDNCFPFFSSFSFPLWRQHHEMVTYIIQKVYVQKFGCLVKDSSSMPLNIVILRSYVFLPWSSSPSHTIYTHTPYTWREQTGDITCYGLGISVQMVSYLLTHSLFQFLH